MDENEWNNGSIFQFICITRELRMTLQEVPYKVG